MSVFLLEGEGVGLGGHEVRSDVLEDGIGGELCPRDKRALEGRKGW